MPRAQNLLLLAASYYFYASWNLKFLGLLVLTTLVDYACALLVARAQDERWRRATVACSMALNLGMLGYFKYYNFFAESVHDALANLGVAIPRHHLEIALPIGISFYTFQSMSYVIDVYRRQIDPRATWFGSPCSCRSFPTWSPDRSCGPRRCFPRSRRAAVSTCNNSTKAHI